MAVFIVLLVALEALLVLPSILRKRRWTAAGIADVDRMTDVEFEEFLSNLFRIKGYRTQLTPVNDYGGDVIADGPGGRVVVQAKHRTREDVGLKAVQEAHTALGYYRGALAVVVTNRYYTRQAITLAKATKVELWDRDRLAGELLAVRAPGVTAQSGRQS